MEKFESMQQNKIDDEELDQITGGKNLFDLFTTEFRGPKKELTTLEMRPDEENDIRVTTLEMRVNPLDPDNNNRKTVKL